jgi:hypothetical protein
MLGLDLLQALRGEGKRLVPAHHAPRLVDAIADHRLCDAVLVVGIAPGEAPFDAAVAAIGLAVLPRHHAHQLFAFHLGAEGAADTAIGAGGYDGALGLADFLHCLFLKCRGWAGLHARAAGDALGGEEIVARLPGAHLCGEAASVHRQREGALHLVARTHAARAGDALAGVEIEIGVGAVHAKAEMIVAGIAIAHVAQADFGGGVLQLAVVIGAARQAIERMIGDVKFHHPSPQLFEAWRLGVDDHALLGRGGAARRCAAPSLDLDQAQAA